MVSYIKKILLLFLIYFKHIVFAKNHFKISILEKLKANINGYMADQYVLYDLKINDKNKYLSEMDWHKSRFINEPFQMVLNNKIICNQMLSHYIKVPKIYFIKDKNIFYGENNKVFNIDDVINILKVYKKIFLKPYLGGKGIDVYYLEYLDDNFLINQKKKAEDEVRFLLNSNKRWILCEVIEQHDYSNKIYDKTFNTIRILAIRDIKTNKMKINFAVQRIGTKQTIPVDNGSRGAIVAKINLDNGELTEARSLHNSNIYREHPDSKNVIKGVKIPNWNKIKNQILELSNQFPYLKIIAWDVLVMKDGNISIIEANNSSGINILQLWGGLKQNELGDFFAYHGVIKR